MHWHFHVQQTLLLLLIQILLGCAIKDTGFSRDGYYKTLPSSGMRLLVVGNNRVSVGASKIWLEKVGLTVVLSTNSQKEIQTKKRPTSSSIQFQESLLLDDARARQVNYLVVNETTITPVMRLKRVDQAADETMDEENLVTVNRIHVAIRGINVKTEEVDWFGMAQAPEVFSHLDSQLEALTWDALGTAWGVLPIRFENRPVSSLESGSEHSSQ